MIVRFSHTGPNEAVSSEEEEMISQGAFGCSFAGLEGLLLTHILGIPGSSIFFIAWSFPLRSILSYYLHIKNADSARKRSCVKG